MDGKIENEDEVSAVLGEKMTFPFSSKVSMNRFMKAPMSEEICTFDINDLDARGEPTPAYIRLYEVWGAGQIGVIVSGNVMIHREHMEAAGNIVVEDYKYIDKLKQVAEGAKRNGSLFVGQISHPGRQTPIAIQPHPVSCSDEGFSSAVGRESAKPRALTEAEITDIIERFATTAKVLYDAGWDGVEIHAAHGYLLSQFLSPRVNKRTDQYGGSLENRARLLIEVIRAIHLKVGDPDFIVGVKLNSGDFTKDGFSPEDCKELAELLANEVVDFLDLTGGTYENNLFERKPKSTKAREAYFLEFADNLRPHLGRMRLAVTGGFRTAKGMVDAVKDKSTDFIGIGRPMCFEPHLCKHILSGEVDRARRSALVGETGRLLQIVVAGIQLRQIANGEEPTSYAVGRTWWERMAVQGRIMGLIYQTLTWVQVKLLFKKMVGKV